MVRLESNMIWTLFGLDSNFSWTYFWYIFHFCVSFAWSGIDCQNHISQMLRYMLDTVQKVARGGILATLRLSLDQWISEIAIMSSMCSSRRQIMAGNCVAWGDVEAAQNVFSKERMKNYSKLSYARFISHLMRKYLVESVIN